MNLTLIIGSRVMSGRTELQIFLAVCRRLREVKLREEVGRRRTHQGVRSSVSFKHISHFLQMQFLFKHKQGFLNKVKMQIN